MSTRTKARRPRKEVLEELARVGREHSDATVLFHSTVARQMGLNPTDYKVMSVLERSGPLSAGELSKLTGLATASVTDLIDRLSAKGFVQRERDTVDRRRVVIRPVAEKVREARRYFVSTAESLSRLFADFGDDELETIASFLRRNAERLLLETDKVERLDAMHPQEVRRA